MVVRGVEALSGCPVEAWDIRAGAAVVLAGLAAEGTTTVAHAQHIDRGYSAFDQHLARSRRRCRSGTGCFQSDGPLVSGMSHQHDRWMTTR